MVETQNNQFRDEIDIVDIFRVLWKRKKLIIGGTLSCILCAAVINYILPKIYRVDMVVQPGILKISQSGSEKNIYIDSVQNIKAMVMAGSFNDQIIQALKTPSEKKNPDKLNLKLSVEKGSNILKIYYETIDCEQGRIVLTVLKNLLLKEYAKIVDYHRSLYEFQLEIKKNEIKKMEAVKSSYINTIKNLEARISQLNNEIEEVNKSTRLLRDKRDNFLSENTNKNNVLSAMLYSNSIQSNLALSNNYKDQLSTYILKKEDVALNLEKVETDIADIDQKMKHLLFQMNSIQNIQILQPPTCEPNPVKPRKTINIIMSAVIGLFLMLIVALIVEYMNENRKPTSIYNGKHV